MDIQLTSVQKEEYQRDGYTIVKGAFDSDECDRFIEYMMDLHAGRKTVEGYPPREPDDWQRTHNRSLHEPVGLEWMLDSRLYQPVRTLLDDEPDAVQSMYFYVGSEQRRHQDAYHLPGCMSAWIALQEVGAWNGSIHVQVGSHKGPLIDKKDFRADENGKPGPWYGWQHEDAFEALFERNGLPEVAVEASKGMWYSSTVGLSIAAVPFWSRGRFATVSRATISPSPLILGPMKHCRDYGSHSIGFVDSHRPTKQQQTK